MAMLEGERESGDRYVVREFPGGTLVAAVDGLGHGGEAAHAARIASAELEDDPGAGLPQLFERCHRRLKRTRGVVMSVATFNHAESSMSWLGVGNVEGFLVRAGAEVRSGTDAILLLGGVVGYNLPRLRPSTTSVTPGDTVILATDGVEHGYLERLDRQRKPQELADEILASHGRSSDDALVVVARYTGAGV
jgi:phosphoserine phosphatase RsbX